MLRVGAGELEEGVQWLLQNYRKMKRVLVYDVKPYRSSLLGPNHKRAHTIEECTHPQITDEQKLNFMVELVFPWTVSAVRTDNSAAKETNPAIIVNTVNLTTNSTVKRNY